MYAQNLSDAALNRATHRFSARLERGKVVIPSYMLSPVGRAVDQCLDTPSARDLADDIKSALSLSGVGVSKDLVLEAIAAFRGVRDWNTLSALLPSEPTWAVPGATMNAISAAREAKEAALCALKPEQRGPLCGGGRSYASVKAPDQPTLKEGGKPGTTLNALLQNRSEALLDSFTIEDPPEVVSGGEYHSCPWGKCHICARGKCQSCGDLIHRDWPGEVLDCWKCSKIQLDNYVGRLVSMPRQGTHLFYLVPDGKGDVRTNLPIDKLAPVGEWGLGLAETALLAATFLSGSTFPNLAADPGVLLSLAHYSRWFAGRFLLPLITGNPVFIPGHEIHAWMLREGIWWWRDMNERPDTLYI